MPMTHSVDHQRRLLTVEVSGTLTTREIIAAIDAAAADLGPGRYRVLSDHRQLTTPATTEQVEAVVDHLSGYPGHFGGSQWAVVVGQPASYGMIRMMSVLAERIPMEVQVFTTRPEAERWIDSPAFLV